MTENARRPCFLQWQECQNAAREAKMLADQARFGRVVGGMGLDSESFSTRRWPLKDFKAFWPYY